MATYIKVSIGWATENNERMGYGLLGGLNQEVTRWVWPMQWAISGALALLVD
jgi:hypothetical protein